MTSAAASFPVLSLCTASPSNRAVGGALRSAIADAHDWDAIVEDAEWHGVDALLFEHARTHGIELPDGVARRLKTRAMQHSHAAAVRAEVVGDVLSAFTSAGISSLVLKGAALAYLVYPSPRLRPMRDVDLLVAPAHGNRAWALLRAKGFSPSGPDPGSAHRHLRPLAATIDGVRIAIEIHIAPLAATPFVKPLVYADLVSRSQTFVYGRHQARTLAREEMMWHVYAHAFLVGVRHTEARLVSIADLILAVEAWADELEWDRLRDQYPRLIRALTYLGGLVPWSSRVAQRIRSCTPDAASDWRFDIRYGIDGPLRRFWSRLLVHPATATISAVDVTRRRFLSLPRT